MGMLTVNAVSERNEKMGKLQLETMVLGMVETNCYLMMNRETKELLIVDPADQAERVAEKIRVLDAKPLAILLTHGHFDHIGAAGKLAERYGIPVCILRQEEELVENAGLNASLMMTGRSITLTPDHLLEDGEILELAGFQIRVIHTPGHTSGGACYYLENEKVLFSGDTLFCCSVGRCDLPTGSMGQLRDSVHKKLFVLPEDTQVYPGHGEMTSIRYEKRYNPY